jgi:hypothetical protein
MVDRDQRRWTGGCQCGAVRYAATEAPHHASVCHCRMCQKASGGPLMAFARVSHAALRWTRGKPAIFRSSSLVERGFCAGCGTPLTYQFLGRPHVSLTLGSLDDPEAVRPELQYAPERMLSWLPGIAGLPATPLDDFITPDLAARFISHQYPDRED